MIMSINDIIIPKKFAESTPNNFKLKQCRRIYENHNIYDRKIVVNNQNVLIDGYILYLVLKESGCEKIHVEISDKKSKYNKKEKYRHKPTFYIFIKHCNNKMGKIYVWRVKNDEQWLQWVFTLKIGDIIKLPNKKGGFSYGKVMDIAEYEQCPFHFNVSPLKNMEIYNELKNFENKNEIKIKQKFFSFIKRLFQSKGRRITTHEI